MLNDKIWISAFAGLKNHPRELLAALCLAVGCALYWSGLEPYIAFGIPGLMFVINGLMTFFQHSHERKMAEIEVRQIENLQGAAVRAKAKKALDRRSRSSAKP